VGKTSFLPTTLFLSILSHPFPLPHSKLPLEVLPDDGKRYEIVDGELYVSKQPRWYHQLVCTRLTSLLDSYSKETRLGFANQAPEVVFADDDVAPDVMDQQLTASNGSRPGRKAARSSGTCDRSSLAGTSKERRDREAKLKPYSRRGVSEYWIVDWVSKHILVYEREDAQLRPARTLYEIDILTSDFLPGFSAPVADLVVGIPAEIDQTSI
jgi:Uma2 family endonuclease